MDHNEDHSQCASSKGHEWTILESEPSMNSDWHHHPPIDISSPGLAVHCGPNGVWAGGLGGVAWFSPQDGWTPLLAGLALTSVSALASSGDCLLAGGGGGIARSRDRGRSWELASVPDGIGAVTAIAPSPNVAQDGTVLAATVSDGILRSTDGGRSWQRSSYGLESREVMALAWGREETAVAATASGLFRSPNAGRAWRVCQPTKGIAFAALAAQADGAMLAAPEAGPLFRATDNFASWSTIGHLPAGLKPWTLLPLAEDRVLLGSADRGIWLSRDGGTTWSVAAEKRALALTAADGHVYAGTTTGVSLSTDGGETWRELPPSPLHDLRRLLVVHGVPIVSGASSPPVALGLDGAWTALGHVPLPVAGLFAAPDHTIFAAGPSGLFRSSDLGKTWLTVVAGNGGWVKQMTFLPDGTGWAGETPDAALLRTQDFGRTWERLRSPFGVLPLVAMQALPNAGSRGTEVLMAATYDNRQHAVSTWRSDDGGECWVQGVNSYTAWPVVATCGTPPLLTIGNVITVRHPDGKWRQATIGQTGIRRLVADGAMLFALATDGLWCSDDLGLSWGRDDRGLAVDRVMDMALDAGMLYVLLAGGRLWSRPL